MTVHMDTGTENFSTAAGTFLRGSACGRRARASRLDVGGENEGKDHPTPREPISDPRRHDQKSFEVEATVPWHRPRFLRRDPRVPSPIAVRADRASSPSFRGRAVRQVHAAPDTP